MKNFNESIEVLKKYNKEPFHIEHGITVGMVLGWFAKNAGMSDEEVEYWKTVGLLHDIDFEMYPEEHCKKCVELLKNEGYDDEFIKSVCSHGFGHCVDVEPSKEMELGDYELCIDNAKLVNDQLLNIRLFGTTSKLTLKEAASGDVNGDNMIDTQDAILVIQYYLGANPSNFNASKGDVNGDGKIDTQDAILIIQNYLNNN